MKAAIVYNLPDSKNSADDLDVLVQVEAVKKSIDNLGHEAVPIGISLNLESFEKEIREIDPDLVFNLVEAIAGVEMYLHFVPVILEKLNIPFTGASAQSLFTTTNKIFTKKLFNIFNIPTPAWITKKNIARQNNLITPCIIKPVYEDASVGLDDSSIVYDNEKLLDEFNKRTSIFGECFAEEFIDGREFNISIIETNEEPVVLPIAEIRFEDYPDDKAKIVNYDAKWNEDSFEYKHTVRHFDFETKDEDLLKRIKEISLECWNKFELKGYARVDLRTDNENNIYVLEINANPCISPDSGFAAAAEQNGWDYDMMVDVITKSGMQK
jgi:D-alanine-D-alanine ligase